MQDTERLTEIIKERYHILDEQGIERIRHEDLAAFAYVEIDPTEIAPILVRIAAILELRQLSRSVLRDNQHAEDLHSAEQIDLFEFKLQRRYPTEDGYTLRSALTFEERWENIARLRKEAASKILHANVLQAETEDLERKSTIAMETESEP